MSVIAISADSLTKDYGAIRALGGVKLSVPRGSIYGFLGRNGAGKTTTIRILMGLARATGGNASVLDMEWPDQGLNILRRTAYVGESKCLLDSMTGAELVRFNRPFFATWSDSGWHRRGATGPNVGRTDLGRLLFSVVRFPLLIASAVLTTMVMYGLTYLLTVLTRSGQRAIAYTFAIVLSYSMIGSVLARWIGVSLPVLTFYLVDPHARQSWHLSPMFQLVLWSICAIAFPLAAQFVLEKAEM
jgi:ABC-type Fe3+/spermidine/putrescine transport system ATPase subunit